MASSKLTLGQLSGLQFGTMVTAGYMAIGIFYFPRELVSAAGRGGIWGLWLDGGVVWALMQLSFKMSRLVPSQTFGQYSGHLLSKPVGFLLGVVTVAYHLALAVVIIVLFTSFMANDFLPGTPAWAMSASLVATSVYMAWFGTITLARTLEAGYIPMVILTALTLLLSLSVVRHPFLMLPPTNVAVAPILRGAYREFFIFIGFEISITLYPFVSPSDQPRAEIYATGGLAAMMVILTAMYETIISTYGPSYIPYIRWPIVSLMRIVHVSGFFVDKWGALVVSVWTVAVVAFLALRLWCLAHDLAAMFFVHSQKAYRYLMTGSAVVAYAISLAIPNAALTNIFTEQWLIPIGLVYLTTVPLLALIVSALRPVMLKKLRHLSAGEPQGPP